MYFVLKKMQNLRKGYRMNTQLKSTSRIIKNILTAFLIATMVYGSLPAMPAHASTFQVNSSLDTADISLDGVCDVTADDSVDVCTLRAAIMEANQVDDTDMISAAVIATSQEPKYAVLERLLGKLLEAILGGLAGFAAGRPMVLSICEWGDNRPWEWGAEVGHLCLKSRHHGRIARHTRRARRQHPWF